VKVKAFQSDLRGRIWVRLKSVEFQNGGSTCSVAVKVYIPLTGPGLLALWFVNLVIGLESGFHPKQDHGFSCYTTRSCYTGYLSLGMIILSYPKLWLQLSSSLGYLLQHYPPTAIKTIQYHT